MTRDKVVIEDGIEVNWSTGANTLGIVALLEETVDTTDWELEPSFCRARYRFAEGKLEVTRDNTLLLVVTGSVVDSQVALFIRTVNVN